MQLRSWVPVKGTATPVATIPANPAEGDQVLHTPTRLPLVWDGAAWRSLAPGVKIHPNPGGLAVRRSVTNVGGVLAMTDPAVHDRSDGVVLAIIDANLVAITDDGEVQGFAGLAAGPIYVAAAGGGVLTQAAQPGANLIPVGYTLSATAVQVRPDSGIGFG